MSLFSSLAFRDVGEERGLRQTRRSKKLQTTMLRPSLFALLREKGLYILPCWGKMKVGGKARTPKQIAEICQGAAKGGVTKGGVFKRKQTRANAEKRRFQAL